jgi:hypothetical protein
MKRQIMFEKGIVCRNRELLAVVIFILLPPTFIMSGSQTAFVSVDAGFILAQVDWESQGRSAIQSV